ncbi:zinc finger protein 570-like [Trichogramma pretiosum]|uniref:zinc finger protein 570-like n=1 Tax=Trichogramma pretiosum TaxID=7493 RepID=UPI000C718998|nr:zinc finger protein 570-like [Trichogramma pretiosum]
MSSPVTSCFKCQINFSCAITLEFHQLMFHYKSDDNLESQVYIDPRLTDTSHQDVGEQVPSSEQNPCEEPQNDIDDFDWTTFNEVLSTELDCELESHMDLDSQLIKYQDVQENVGEQTLTTEPNPCEESQNDIEDFDWTTFNEVPSIEADWELESYIGLDPLLSEPQDVQKNLGEQVLATEPYFCEESQNEIDDFDWTTFNEVSSIEADWELESYIGLDPLLSEPQDVQKNLGEQVLATEPYFCEESQNKIDDFDWTTFNEVPSTELDCELESHMDLDPQLIKYQDVQEDVDEQILTTEPNPCQESLIKSDDFHQTSFIQVSRTEVNCDQEQNEHRKTVQKKFCKERKDSKCNVCQKTFTQQRHLKTHVKTVHDKQRDYECDVCQKRFSSKTYVKIHKKVIHDKQKDYECDVCHKVFSEQGNLKQHKNAVHEGQKNFECNVCQKTFAKQNNLRRHQKAIHKGQKDYECDVCQKIFTNQGHLKIHVITVHEKQKDFHCHVCQKSFTQKGSLKMHMKTVHDKQKDFECHVCLKLFSRSSHLKAHLTSVHEGRRDYECEVCQKKFSQKNNLKLHNIKTVHDKQKDCECDVCQKKFLQKNNLKLHIKTVHDKQKDYECNVCHQTFTQKVRLNTHIKTVHKNSSRRTEGLRVQHAP